MLAARYRPGVAGTFTIDEARQLLADARTAAVLDPAKAAALDALQRAFEADELSEADAADYAASINAFRDAYKLDEWLHRQPPLLSRRICNYPLCFASPRPSNNEERTGGNPPVYCAGVNERQQPHAISQNAVRRRTKLREAAEAGGADQDSFAGPSPAAAGPVTEARSTFSTGTDRVVRSMEELVEAVRELRDAASRGRDDALVQAEIESIRNEANETVSHERALKGVFEQRAITAEAAVGKANADLAQLADAYTEVELQVAQGAADRAALALAALLALFATRSAAEAELAQTRRDAEQELSAARTEFETALAQHDEEAAVKIAAAAAATNAALDTAKDAAVRLATANQRVEDMQANLATATERAESLSATNAALHNAAVEREREFQQAMERQGAEHDRTLSAVQGKYDALRDQVDGIRVEHENTLKALNADHRRDLAAQLDAAAVAAEQLKTAELGALNAQVKSLTEQLRARDDELRRLRASVAGTEDGDADRG